MGVSRKLQNVFRVKKAKILPGHDYTDEVTGESITVDSVGPQVVLTRHDASVSARNSLPKQQMRTAIQHGVVTHDENTCRACNNV